MARPCGRTHRGSRREMGAECLCHVFQRRVLFSFRSKRISGELIRRVRTSTGCGADIGVADGKIVGIRGRAVDRVNHGRLGPKGMCSWEYNGHPDRLKTPVSRRVDV